MKKLIVPDYIEAERKQKTKDNVLAFVKPDGGGPKTEDWLRELPVGTEFVARVKNSASFIVTRFMRGGERGKYILVLEDAGERSSQFFVDSERFSAAVELLEIWKVPELENGDNNGNGD